jgi:drug/metabolite transporter (DMT)-like permease
MGDRVAITVDAPCPRQPYPPPMPRDQHTLPRSTWVLLAALTLGWGCNWPMMKLALAEVPVWTLRGVSVAAGAAGMFVVAAARGQRLLPPGDHWPRLAITAVFNVTLWNLLVAYGLLHLPAGRSVILAYTMPLWTVLLSRVVLGEALSARRMLGLALGMLGMLLLIGDEFALLQAAPVGALLVVGAALAWAVGTVLMKRFPTRLPITSFTGWQLLLGGAPMALGALVIDWGDWQPISWRAAGAVAYNVVVAFVLCHWIWFEIVDRASAGVSALGTLTIPVVGVISSMLVLGERPAWPEYAAMVLVIAALATVLVPVKRRAPS